MEALRGHRKRQLQEKLLLGQEYKDQALVFTTPFGGIIDKDNLSKRLLPRLLKKAGIGKKIRFHVLRHTAASLLLAEGVPIKTVQAVLGHSTASMTLDRYGPPSLVPEKRQPGRWTIFSLPGHGWHKGGDFPLRLYPTPYKYKAAIPRL